MRGSKWMPIHRALITKRMNGSAASKIISFGIGWRMKPRSLVIYGTITGKRSQALKIGRWEFRPRRLTNPIHFSAFLQRFRSWRPHYQPHRRMAQLLWSPSTEKPRRSILNDTPPQARRAQFQSLPHATHDGFKVESDAEKISGTKQSSSKLQESARGG